MGESQAGCKETPLRRSWIVGLVPCGISKGAGKTGSHLTWPEVIKLHHYLVQKDKKRARSERSLSKQDELVSGGGGRGGGGGQGKHRKR